MAGKRDLLKARQRCLAAWLLGLVFLWAKAATAAEFTGRVVGSAAGDTLTVRPDEGPAVRIRLWGIDAPERGQAYTSVAKRYLAALAFGKRVRVLVRDLDRYGRTVAEIILPDGRNANHEMVRAGYAWWHRRYAPHDRVLEQLEAEARQDRRGLWADPRALPPWITGGCSGKNFGKTWKIAASDLIFEGAPALR